MLCGARHRGCVPLGIDPEVSRCPQTADRLGRHAPDLRAELSLGHPTALKARSGIVERRRLARARRIVLVHDQVDPLDGSAAECCPGEVTRGRPRFCM